MRGGRDRGGPAPAVLGVLLLVLAGGAAEPPAPPGDAPAPAIEGPPPAARPRIGLALSGGGARGIAHVAVLEYLERQRIPIDCIAGTSMGAIVGGLYASGMTPEQIRAALRAMDWNDLFDDRPPRRDMEYRRKEDDATDLIKIEMGLKNGRVVLPRGLVAGQKIGFALESLTIQATGVTDFDRLPIPFRAVATDLGTGEMVVLDRGPLADALRASMSIPGAIEPVEMDGRILVDGGLVRNLPVDVARAMGADVVIAVDVSTPLLTAEQLRGLTNVTSQVTGMLTRENVEEQIPKADLLIVPDLHEFGFSDYASQERILERGAQAAAGQQEALQRYALPEDEYRDRLARVHAGPAGPPRIDSVTLEGNTRVDPRIIRRRIETQAGAPLDLRTLKRDLMHIYELGDFQRVDFLLDQRPEGTRLVVRAREKPWGPNYLRFGMNMRNDFQGDADFSLVGRLTMTRLNPLGGEWRSDLELGQTRRVGTEFYQPIDFAGVFFVVPSLDYINSIIQIFDDDVRIADYHTRSLSGSLAIGAQLGRYGEVRAGALKGWVRARPLVGDPTLPVLDIPTAAWAARVSVDRLDNPNFPHKGRVGGVDVYLSRRSLGSDASYDRVTGGITQVFSRGRHHVFMAVEGGSNLGSEIPFYDELPLGGLFSLSGFKDGELRGQEVGVARSGYYRRAGRLSGMFGTGVYFGGWLEAGNVWRSSHDISVRDLRYAGTVTFGADTLFGPIFLAYGLADGGHNAFYLSMGRSLGARRQFGFSH